MRGGWGGGKGGCRQSRIPISSPVSTDITICSFDLFVMSMFSAKIKQNRDWYDKQKLFFYLLNIFILERNGQLVNLALNTYFY